jgi:choline-sulfatase
VWVSVLAGCSRGREPDVVVITLDTVRADRLGCYGHRGGLTPALDRLASRGVLFEDASCPVPLTLPSHASLFTGRYPTATGVRNNGTFLLPDAETTLAERLEASGFATGAVIAAHPLESRYGLAQGFAIYDESLPRRRVAEAGSFAVHIDERGAREVTDRALDVWTRLSGRPRFLWVHYFDAHAPYAAPDPWGSAHIDHPYDGEIAYVDSELARLLARIERDSPDAVVVVAADHGEGLGEHGEQTHGVFLYQSTVHVPLLVRAPGRWPEGKRVTVGVTLADVVPTILALVGAPVPSGLSGSDLAPAVFGSALGSREVYAESYLPLLQFRFSPLTMLRDGSLKYIDAPTVELYDLSRDPAELSNLAGEAREATGMRSRLAVVTAGADPDAAGRAAGALDAESEARLRSLGYTSAGTPGASRQGRGRDPKEMTAYLRRYDRAVGLQSAGRIEEGLAELRRLIPEAPENPMVRYQIAAGLLAAGRADEARVELAKVLAAAPEFGNAHFMLGDCLVALGRLDEAVASYEAAAALSPRQAEPRLAQGRALEERGRFDAAARAYRAAVASEPSSTAAAEALLALHAGRGDLSRAVRELRELAARFPSAAAVLTALAEAEYRTGDAAGAGTTLRRVYALDPTRTDAKLLEASILLDANGPEGAAELYRAVLRARPGMRAAELGLGRALALSSNSAEGASFIAGLAARYPKDAAPRVLRGVLAERRGEFAEALSAYREALALDPRNADAGRGVARIEAREPGQ